VRRVLIVAVLLLSVLNQSMASTGQGLLLHAADGLQHGVLHWDKQSHHHHEDGTFHQEDSDEGFRHLQQDAFLSVMGLPSGAALSPLAATPWAPAVIDSLRIPSPVLDGPRRPPRLSA
jgi:hypothetical protein